MILNYISMIISCLDLPLYVLLTIFLIIDYKYPKYILVFSIGIIVFNILEYITSNLNLVVGGVFGIFSVVSYFLLFLTIFLKQPKSINNKLID